MWPLAAFGPIGWGIAIVSTVAVAYELMDNEEETSNYTDKHEIEEEPKKRSKRERRTKAKQDIKRYKQEQVKRLKDKYDVDIEFINGDTGIANKIKICESNENDSISFLENETYELIQLIEKLKDAKHETFG